MTSIGVCIACFNRKATTLACLSALRDATLPADTKLQIYLVDDASSDGTADSVVREFPEVTILRGTGFLYWGGGMRLAMKTAMQVGHDFYLWLNDDVTPRPDFLQRLFKDYARVSSDGSLAIVAGATRDPVSGELSYSGMIRDGLNPLRFKKVVPSSAEPTGCETMNGNIVLIPSAVAALLGNIDSRFTHQMGDLDFGLRARRAGASIWLATGHLGECRSNTKVAAWKTSSLPFTERLRMAMSPRGLPITEWLAFCYRHAGMWGSILGLLGYRNIFFPKQIIADYVERGASK